MTQLDQLKLSGQLPSPRGVALAVLELSRRDNATLGEIARVVQTDPALSGRLIKLANSASHIARPVVSVQEAVVRQGMSTVRQLALGFSLLDQFRNGACTAFDYQEYWSHSLLMALSLQALGARVHVAAADELFICGLLAQVGRLALATAYPAEYDAVLHAHRTDPSKSLITLERSRLEIDHIELGIVMMTDWGMPRVFTIPLAHYQDPEYTSFPHDSRANSLMLMLRLSHRLADLALGSADGRMQLAREWMTLATELDLPPENAGSFIDEVIAQWHDWGALLKIPTSVLPPFAEISHGSAEASDDEAPLRIVVADGNAFTRRKIMALLVEDSGHVVYPADNGNSALALAMEVLPHVIIAHINLPLLDGLELCQALRATDEGRRMHILLMSDEHAEDQLARAYEAGADGYAHSALSAKSLRTRLCAAQRLLQLQNAWERDRAQLRQIAAELAVANRRLANAALTDALTGLPNRRSAMDQLEQAWSAAARADTPLAVMVVDIDHFKHINDTHGHALGDKVLREAANALRASSRREDSVCRIGGEEFLVICPNTDLAAAMQSAERLRATLSARRIAVGEAECTITASIGVAVREYDTADIDGLVSAADQALYAAKEAGRNQVCTQRRRPVAVEAP
ncbi:Putative diguanylate cyclase (GGDEF domain) [Thiobacillus denitrificans ATCC 25259]|uniref:diguanylate cyclase n=1 Tax=Thiobacillus denitrificans (strain ATCC 25259 / T1) TaxID=292415 RepID=Q3SEU1_THIDA|nr:diguanylate cyclase [Thiobacillus denitrificans]AAZ97976.1 Putative diguanylate cyclase (GGDEF domain) [Thiobacillus denitrificans ATCC 25259]